jgi:uncharacterized membrane protein
MNLNKKDILILIIPVIIMIILIPFLPDQIPMQWNSNGDVNWYLDKRLSFLLGLIPFIVYKLYKIKHNYK